MATEQRDDLAALRGRIEGRIEDAVIEVEDAKAVLSGLRMELADLPIPGTRLYASGSLTTQEMVVLNLLASGASTKEIAAELVIAEATVRNHIAACMAKTQSHTRLSAVVAAQRDGLVD